MMPKDLITEEDFTRKTSGHVPKSPQRDSPGDTAADRNVEIEMGFNYQPEEEPRPRRKKDIPAFDKSH